MINSKLVMAFAFSIALAGCGGGGSDDKTATPPTVPEAPDEEGPSVNEGSSSEIELATIPSLEGMAGLTPPGVPRLN